MSNVKQKHNLSHWPIVSLHGSEIPNEPPHLVHVNRRCPTPASKVNSFCTFPFSLYRESASSRSSSQWLPHTRLHEFRRTMCLKFASKCLTCEAFFSSAFSESILTASTPPRTNQKRTYWERASLQFRFLVFQRENVRKSCQILRVSSSPVHIGRCVLFLAEGASTVSTSQFFRYQCAQTLGHFSLISSCSFLQNHINNQTLSACDV